MLASELRFGLLQPNAVSKMVLKIVMGLFQCRAFSELKSTLCNMPLIIFPDAKLPYTMVIDGSADMVAGVLM